MASTTSSTAPTKEEFEALIAHAATTITDTGQTFEEAELRKVLAEALGYSETATPVKEASAKKGIDVNAGTKLKVNARRAVDAIKEEPYWYESEQDRQRQDWFVSGHKAGIVEGNLLIMGPAGSGKTEGVLQAGKRLSIPVNVVHCASITSIEKWVGQRDVNASGTFFTPSDVMEMLRGEDSRFPPGVALFDEITRLHPTYHNILLPLLDGQRRIWIPELHDFLDVHPGVIIIATANIGGRYTGTYKMDHAFRDRFLYTIERDFPPKEDEVRIITTRTGLNKEAAELIVDIANKTRKFWRSGDLSLPVSTRALLAIAPLVRDGASVASAFEFTVLPMYDADGGSASERATVKGAITGKAGE